MILSTLHKYDISEEIIHSLISEEVIKDDKINSKYSIGTIELKNHYALFRSFFHNELELRIDKNELHGAYSQDIVLIKKIFNPRAKYKAKVEYVLKRGDNVILALIQKNHIVSIKEHVKLAKSDLEEDSVVLFNTKEHQVKEILGSFKDDRIDEDISLTLYKEHYRKGGLMILK